MARRIAFTTAVGGDVAGRHILDYTADISLGGLYIRTNKINAAPGTPIKITLRVPGMTKRVSLDGVIIRHDAGEAGGLAIRFSTLPREVDSALAVLTGEELATEEIVLSEVQ
jgi:hypothetical protein